MSEEDCVDFIVENGVTIPDGWINENGFGHYVQSIIQSPVFLAQNHMTLQF